MGRSLIPIWIDIRILLPFNEIRPLGEISIQFYRNFSRKSLSKGINYGHILMHFTMSNSQKILVVNDQ